MTSGRPLPLILNFSVPLLLGNMLQQTYSIVDAAIVGQCLGINALASVGASGSVIFLILGFCNGCCGGFAIPVAQKFGARDYRSMRRLVAMSFKVSGIMAVLVAAVTCVLCPYILHWMQTPEVIFSDANAYLFVTFLGIPATLFYNLLSSVIRALGDSKTPSWFLLFSTVLNIVLDLVCILVLGWGVAGAAIATVVAQAVSAVLCYVYMKKKFAILHMQEGDNRWHAGLARTLLSVGVPMGHMIISVQSTLKGLRKLLLHQESIDADLNEQWAVVAEAIQTILRREAYPHPYEALKALTRTNEAITEQSIHNFIQGLEVSDAVKQELMQITPGNYTGI